MGQCMNANTRDRVDEAIHQDNTITDIDDAGVFEVSEFLFLDNRGFVSPPKTPTPGTDVQNKKSRSCYSLVVYDEGLYSQESYAVYTEDVRLSYRVFLDKSFDVKQMDIPEGMKIRQCDVYWQEFKERKRFLEENLANLDVMDALA
jgi:hypothetical protein